MPYSFIEFREHTTAWLRHDVVRIPQPVPRGWLARKWYWFKVSLIYRWCEPHEETITRVEPVRVSVDNIVEMITRQHDALHRIINKGCRHVIVGPRQMFELQRDCTVGCVGPMNFGVPLRIGVDGKIEVLGMQVHLIPWFDGVLLLPELKSVYIREASNS